MEIVPLVLVVALVNGCFLLLSKAWAERKLAEARQQHERELEHLKTSLTALRELALKHFDRRATLYWDALEPFLGLFAATAQGPASPEEAASFQRAALSAGARIHLFAPAPVAKAFDEMLEWTERRLPVRQPPVGISFEDEARAHALRFVRAAHDDLLSVPVASTLATPSGLNTLNQGDRS